MCRPVRVPSRAVDSVSHLEALEPRLLLTTYTPSQIRDAYGINGLAAGAGQTIAIVDAFNNNHLAADLNTFDKNLSMTATGPTLYDQWGDASKFLTVTTLGGASTLADADWGMETALDVQWAHAIAPAAKIVVVQARSDSLADLLAAVDYARKLPSVSVVSMSWGAGEWSNEASYDSHFTTPAGHKGITFVASSGDYGASTGVSWPSIAANVLSVGGTNLTLAGNTYISEAAWSGSGGGYSKFESRPAYQNAVNSTNKRANPDVAYDADPATGFYVYNSDYYDQAGWWNLGGTSAGAPQWAALVALADQVRAYLGKDTLTTAQTLASLYAQPASNFHDITLGTNGFTAKPGYDLATGRGSPIASKVVNALAYYNAAGAGSASATTSTTTTTMTSFARRLARANLTLSSAHKLIKFPTITLHPTYSLA